LKILELTSGTAFNALISSEIDDRIGTSFAAIIIVLITKAPVTTIGLGGALNISSFQTI